ncbi:hypothetical protein [Pseudanabaena sp. FACHB-2040]|uniref:glutaredoxin family protein n=1 Tax=Pseudanabaena sp. FACHB-2040 TaxID=2692859 RepID=UPI001686CCC9|nr:hypothetical protein [Pseudanabaena sp. FACHB-2040]MBD2257810.1 hypothetical protein [Pseudanabaena sp. FACHB-2040]
MSQSFIRSLLQSNPANRWAQTGRHLSMGAALLTAAVVFGCAPQATREANQQSYEAQLANHLKETGATMYGAYWCPHCAEQKEMFAGAVEQVPYVECDPSGQDPQPQLCQEKGIPGYPTWEIDGELYSGTRSLEELAELSDFQSTQSP